MKHFTPRLAVCMIVLSAACARPASAAEPDAASAAVAGSAPPPQPDRRSRSNLLTEPYLPRIGALRLEGMDGAAAMETLSREGFSCTVEHEAWQEHRWTTCTSMDSSKVPTCAAFMILLANEADWRGKPRDAREIVGRVMAAPVSHALPSCLPKVTLDEIGPTEKWADVPATPEAEAAVDARMRERAAATADLRELWVRELAEGASCQTEEPATGLVCTSRETGCLEARSRFASAAATGKPASLVEATCVKGTRVRVGPKIYHPDKWANYEVLLLAGMCARQDPALSPPAWRERGRFGTAPGAACLAKRKWMPEKFCRDLISLPADDASAAPRFLDEHEQELKRLKPVLDWDNSILQRKAPADSCPDIALPPQAPDAASSPAR